MRYVIGDRRYIFWGFIFVISYLLSFIFFSFAHAAEFYFGAPRARIGVGDTFEVGVFLNTEGETVNALEGELAYSPNLLAPRDIRDGNTIMQFWIERPHVDAEGRMFFAGMIPGGVATKKGYLFSVIFEAIGVGDARVTTAEEWLLLHEDHAVSVPVRRSPLLLSIGPERIIGDYLPPYDTDKPEPFVPTVGQSEALFGGDWFAVFETKDKSSGIDHYEIFESRRRGIPKDARWQRVESPYHLDRQERDRYIYIKAVDKGGNERIAVILPQKKVSWHDRNPVVRAIVGAPLAFWSSVSIIMVFVIGLLRR